MSRVFGRGPGIWRFWAFSALVGVAALLIACGTGQGESTSTGGGGATVTVSTTTTSPPSTGSSASVSTSSSGSTSSPTVAGDWPTYHHDLHRSGVFSDQAPLGDVQQLWISESLGGAIYSQPLIVGDHVLVCTESNTVYALDVGSGSVAWQSHLGEPVPGGELPCGNIDPSGITGTPVVDVGAGIMYVVANLRSGPHHELFALDVESGEVRWHRPIDAPGLSPQVEQQRGALALSDGRIYVPFGGLYGDCGEYKGAIVSVAADGGGEVSSFIVPTSRMGGIWNPAGVVVGGDGDLWVTTGNSASQKKFDFGNSVIRLDPQLTVLDYFAPADWADLNAGDVDLGSLGPVLVSDSRVVAAGKGGVAYLLDRSALGQEGGQIASTELGSSAFGAAAVLGSMLFVPCSRELVGLRVSDNAIEVVWTVEGGAGPPIVAAGTVWYLANDEGLNAVDPASGESLFRASLDRPVSRFVSLCAGGGRLFAPDGDKLVAFSLR